MNDITINTFNKGVDVEQWMDDVVGWMTLLFEHTNYSIKHTGIFYILQHLYKLQQYFMM